MANKTKPAFGLADILKPTAILTAICAIVTLLLAGTNALTMGRIAANAEKKAAESRAKVLAAAEYVKLSEDGSVYQAVGEDGTVAGFVITTHASGYGGDIEVMTGINTSGEITGVNILSMEETPGLGARAKEDAFLRQYGGLASSTLAVNKDGGEIDALSGATITSRAVTKAVNEAVAAAQPYLNANGAAASTEGQTAADNTTTGGQEQIG